MIGINLVKSETAGQRNPFSDLDLKDVVFKFLFLTVGIIFVTYYENYNISILKEELKGLKNRSEQIKKRIEGETQDIKMKNKITDKTSLSQKISQERERKSSLIGLAKQRTQLIKTLDQLQNITPDDLWITGMDYGKFQGSLNTGTNSGKKKMLMKLDITGGAVSMEAISIFIRNLEERGFFENVNMERSKSLYLRGNNNEGTEFVDFKLTGQLRGEA